MSQKIRGKAGQLTMLVSSKWCDMRGLTYFTHLSPCKPSRPFKAGGPAGVRPGGVASGLHRCSVQCIGVHSGKPRQL